MMTARSAVVVGQLITSSRSAYAFSFRAVALLAQ